MKSNASIRRRSKHVLTLPGCLLASTLALQAHPGHGLVDHGFGHALASPWHLGLLALTGATLFGLAQWTRRQLPRRALQGAGGVVLLAAAVLWGLHS